MNKGWIAWIALIIVAVIVVYVYTGFKIPTNATTSTVTTTVAQSNSVSSTTVPVTYLLSCSKAFLPESVPYDSDNVTCQWRGGMLGIWVTAGEAGSASVSIVGANGKSYVQGSFNYNNTVFYKNVTLPAQNYTITLSTGSFSRGGDIPFVKLNLTTAPPVVVYPYIYNANFSNGAYTGWNLTGSGFGPAPLNISYVNANGCFFGAPWSNYIGTFFASTYTCGLGVSPGNLTSSPFRVNPKDPFLNFRIISPQDSLIYVEILEVNGANETPAIIGHFDTYNISLGANVTSTFANASMPLTTLSNKVVMIRVVASTVERQRYISIGNFSLGSLPNTQHGISSQINITG
jgi:hypothetical protein